MGQRPNWCSIVIVGCAPQYIKQKPKTKKQKNKRKRINTCFGPLLDFTQFCQEKQEFYLKFLAWLNGSLSSQNFFFTTSGDGLQRNSWLKYFQWKRDSSERKRDGWRRERERERDRQTDIHECESDRGGVTPQPNCISNFMGLYACYYLNYF